MEKYRIKVEMQRNIFSGIRRISAYAVYVKPHWWSRWQFLRKFDNPVKAIMYINQRAKWRERNK